jgi:SAM-dependent methyltransferase
MSAAFNTNQYWLERGETYFEETFPRNYHQLQERFLCDVLRAGKVPMARVLELGCGFGRITRLLASRYPHSEIHALDLSADQLARARKLCAGHRHVSFNRQDICSDTPFPNGDWETAVAIEVFLHQPADAVLGLFQRLRDVARFIVHIDWSEEWRWATPEHVWVHKYRKLHEQAGLRCAAFTLPEKVEGLQQQLFVAGRELTPELLDLERTARKDGLRVTSAGTALPAAASGAEWLRQLHRAAQDILDVVPRDRVLILVDDNTWGNAQRLLPGRRVLPFLESAGQYWGPPPDDATAIHELERMHAAGAGYLAVAWNSFWWLQHYCEFHQHLCRIRRCVLVSDDVMVFEL